MWHFRAYHYYHCWKGHKTLVPLVYRSFTVDVEVMGREPSREFDSESVFPLSFTSRSFLAWQCKCHEYEFLWWENVRFFKLCFYSDYFNDESQNSWLEINMKYRRNDISRLRKKPLDLNSLNMHAMYSRRSQLFAYVLVCLRPQSRILDSETQVSLDMRSNRRIIYGVLAPKIVLGNRHFSYIYIFIYFLIY